MYSDRPSVGDRDMILACEGPCTIGATWNDRIFEAPRTSGVGQKGLDDSCVFGREIWVATEGETRPRGERSIVQQRV